MSFLGQGRKSNMFPFSWRSPKKKSNLHVCSVCHQFLRQWLTMVNGDVQFMVDDTPPNPLMTNLIMTNHPSISIHLSILSHHPTLLFLDVSTTLKAPKTKEFIIPSAIGSPAALESARPSAFWGDHRKSWH